MPRAMGSPIPAGAVCTAARRRSDGTSVRSQRQEDLVRQPHDRRGKAKYLGGVGKKTTGISRRTFKPNLQRIHVWLPNGTTRYVRVATSVIRTGKLTLEVDGKVQTFPLIKASKGSAKARGRAEEPVPDLIRVAARFPHRPMCHPAARLSARRREFGFAWRTLRVEIRAALDELAVSLLRLAPLDRVICSPQAREGPPGDAPRFPMSVHGQRQPHRSGLRSSQCTRNGPR